MRRQVSVIVASVIAASAMLAAPAAAQAPVVQPYRPVAVKFPEPPDDPSFAAFRGEFATVAKRRVYAELARLVIAHGFFWERDFGAALDPGKSGVENLAVAIGLERGDGQGWTTLATFAAEPTAAPIAARPSVLCAPARPQFDEADYLRLMRKTGTDAADWTYPRHAAVVMRASADAAGAVVETLGLHFVRVLDHTAKGDRARAAWTPVAAPSGRTGFVAPAMLLSLFAERLCYAKDVTGRWRITGYVGVRD